MQLVAMGAQDVFLTGNPQITFFKVVYRRHTNFSKEAIKQEWTGSSNRRTCTLSRNGDLVQEIYIQGANLSNNQVLSVAVEVGGQQIDKHYAQWLNIYDELFDTNEDLKKAIHASYLPLRFWFNRNAGLALPLIALQYHEVKIIADFAFVGSGASDGLLVNYVYLDTDERRRFAQVSHEYLIEQVQHTGVENIPKGAADAVQNKTINLTFNHPVKALFWTGMATVDTPAAGGNQIVTGTGILSYTALLQLNGHDRFSRQSNLYFNGVQPYETGLRPVRNAAVSLAASSAGMYSFCLKPGEHQPSGSCNFSRIDNARLQFTTTRGNQTDSTKHVDSSLSVFALNYNVLRVMSGMGGLTYSN